jgi:hypothetical protein
VLGWTTGNSDSQDSPWPKLGGSHHLPSYSILYTSPRGPHPNGNLSRDSQVGVPKFPQLGLPQVWGLITSRANLRLQWGLKQSCSSHQELSNDISHATCMQGNRVDSQLLMVESQTNSLIPNLSFDHNFCFKCPNGRWKLILDIYVSITFQWYKKLFMLMGSDLYNRALKIWESTRTTTPNMGVHLRVWGFIPSHFLALPGTQWVTIFTFCLPTCLNRKSNFRTISFSLCSIHVHT